MKNEKAIEMENVRLDEILLENKTLKNRVQELENALDKTGAAPGFPPSELVYSTLLRLSPAGICITKIEDGTIFDASDFFCQFAGFTREEVIGKTTVELGLWLDQDRLKVQTLLLKEGKYQNLEMKHRKKDGTVFTSLDSGELITIGNQDYIVVVAIEINALKETEDSLVRERDLNDAIIDSLPGLFFVVDEAFRLLRWNKNFMSITGYSEEELRQMTVLDLHRTSERSIVSEEVQKIFRFGEHAAEADVLLKDGTVKTFFFSAKRLMYQNSPCAVGSGFDITVRKRALEELSRSATDLEEANTALRVFMKNQAGDQQALQEKLQANINDLVIPYLKKIGQGNLDDWHKKYLHILESNLENVLSPFISDFLARHQNFTPQETQIVDLIRKGKNTKEIAEVLNASVNTIGTHRNNIRKKLSLRNSKINLRTHLLSLK